VTLSEAFATPGESQQINRQIPARQGYQITAAKLESVIGSSVPNLQIRIAPDRHAAVVTGELSSERSLLTRNGPLPQLTFRALLTEERRTLHRHAPVRVTATMAATGPTVLTLPHDPCDCCDVQRQYSLELRDGDRMIWRDSHLPNHTAVTIRNRPYLLTATPAGNQVRIELTEAHFTGTVPNH
jgi:hypothetical protein